MQRWNQRWRSWVIVREYQSLGINTQRRAGRNNDAPTQHHSSIPIAKAGKEKRLKENHVQILTVRFLYRRLSWACQCTPTKDPSSSGRTSSACRKAFCLFPAVRISFRAEQTGWSSQCLWIENKKKKKVKFNGKIGRDTATTGCQSSS